MDVLKAGGAEWLIVFVLLLGWLVNVAFYWVIFSKAGFNGAVALLMLVPLFSFVVLAYLALSEWPIERELRALRARLAGGAERSTTGSG